MKKYLGQIKEVGVSIVQFLKLDYEPLPYFLFFVWIVVISYLNFFSELFQNHYSLESYLYALIQGNYGFWGLAFAYFCFYCLLYCSILLVKKKVIFNSKAWLLILLANVILAINSAFYFDSGNFTRLGLDSFDSLVLSNFINNGYQFFTSSLIIFIMYLIFRNNQSSFGFGLGYNKTEAFSPFIFMFLMMVPLVFGASLTTGFKEVYPSFNKNWGAGLGFSSTTIFYINELIYLIDFFNLEYLLRGLFVVGIGQFIGRHAVLPVTLLYFSLHLEKPLAEAISSIFGGYILAIVSLQSKSIWPGVLIHMGIAFLMEFFSLI